MPFDVKTRRYVSTGSAELAYLAVLVSTEAPVRTGGGNARIPWDLVTRIRDVLEKDGFDWKKAARDHKELERKARRAEMAKRYPNEAQYRD